MLPMKTALNFLKKIAYPLADKGKGYAYWTDYLQNMGPNPKKVSPSWG